ncbi:dipeptide epimerase [Limibacterium fermenti]|uniref:dipeptide epimerase n=1 Tax=Limibacterium fermenti TaxID=3229863 RepID=UPI000E92C668|nr:dipeptide epimerase [Porphyromonadaceae bacterium]
MKQNRRQFIQTSASAAAVIAAAPLISAVKPTRKPTNVSVNMKLSWTPYDLQLRHVFTISGFSRKTTLVVLTRIEYDGLTGYGEASLPPYLGETQASVIEFLKKVDLSGFRNPANLEEILEYVDSIAENNTAAKASVDIALHDLAGKMIGAPWYKMYGLDKYQAPDTTFTIGIDSDEVVREKTREALGPFRVLKVKVGGPDDKRMIEAIRSVTDLPLTVDANQGWKDRRQAVEMIHWLKEKGVVMVEQPMSKHALDDIARITEESPLPIFADESVQRLHDVERLKGAFSGINIKLMKCTGLREAWKMRNLAEALGMKVMIGCMTETSCAISAAAQLSPGLDFADLDGALLIGNDCFDGAQLENAKIIASDRPGIGVVPKQKILFGN